MTRNQALPYVSYAVDDAFKAQIKIKDWNAGALINVWCDIGEYATQAECQRACERRNDGSLSWDDFRFLKLRDGLWSTDLR